jgi:hypothetical protein
MGETVQNNISKCYREKIGWIQWFLKSW